MSKYKYVKDLVSIRSYSVEENKEIIDYLISQFQKSSKEIIRIKNTCNAKENLLIGVNCSLKNLSNAIVLGGHIDTVVANEQICDLNPYIATEIGDKIFGLGVIDMKCFWGTVLDNISLLKKLKSPVVVAITSDEETDCMGIKLLVKEMKKRKINVGFSLIGEPTNMLLCTSGKSCYEFRVEVQGKNCHSCNPSNGINANYIVAKLVGEIENLNMCLPNTTLCANVIGGGEKANIVSSSAFVVFDLRTDDNQKLLIVKKKLENFIKKLESDYPGSKIKLITTLDILPFNNFAKNEIIQQINKQCETTEAIFEGACEVGYYQSLGGEAVAFNCGDLSLAHNPNEYLEIKKYEQYDQCFKKIMKIVENKFNF